MFLLIKQQYNIRRVAQMTGCDRFWLVWFLLVLKADPEKVIIKSANAMAKRGGCGSKILTMFLQGNYL